MLPLVAAEAILKWGPRRGPKGGESRHRRLRGGGVLEGVSPSLLGQGPSPENFEFFDLQMMCGAEFNILVTTKSCKNHVMHGNESGRDKEKQTSVVITARCT